MPSLSRALRTVSLASALSALFCCAPALAQDAAAAAPSPYAIDKGDTAWMLVATVLVIFMTLPGLGLFYAGLVRAKNVLSVLMQVLTVFSVIAILWVVYGYSLAFTTNPSAGLNPFIGGLSKVFLSGVTYASDPASLTSVAATFSKNTYLPELVYVIFQMTFAAITPALIVGAFAERMKFSAVIAFCVLWFTFSYLPIAHMVWFWAGPDAYTLSPENLPFLSAALGAETAQKLLADYAAAASDDAKAAVLGQLGAMLGAGNGYLFNLGALDFAGGTVVHINAGVAGLVCALMLGRRVGYGRESMAPHNLPMTLIGASILWFGWFGFNAGSNLEANGLTALVILNTTIATAAAALAWTLGEAVFRGHASLLGGASGAIAGLVAITPACGWVGPMGAIVIGAAAGFVCLWAVVWLKARLGYDDSLDVFGVHGVGGILGALLTGIFFHPSLGGVGITDYLRPDATVGAVDQAIGTQFSIQLQAVIVSTIWTAVVSFVALLLIRATIGLRVNEQDEREGLDITTHGERAYN